MRVGRPEVRGRPHVSLPCVNQLLLLVYKLVSRALASGPTRLDWFLTVGGSGVALLERISHDDRQSKERWPETSCST